MGLEMDVDYALNVVQRSLKINASLQIMSTETRDINLMLFEEAGRTPFQFFRIHELKSTLNTSVQKIGKHFRDCCFRDLALAVLTLEMQDNQEKYGFYILDAYSTFPYLQEEVPKLEANYRR